MHHEPFHFFSVFRSLPNHLTFRSSASASKRTITLLAGVVKEKRFACLQRERNPFFLASPREKRLVRGNAAPLSRNGVNDDAQAVTPPPASVVALERFNERVLAGGRNKALATVTVLLGTMPFGRCTACAAGNDARQVDFPLKFFALFVEVSQGLLEDLFNGVVGRNAFPGFPHHCDWTYFTALYGTFQQGMRISFLNECAISLIYLFTRLTWLMKNDARLGMNVAS